MLDTDGSGPTTTIKRLLRQLVVLIAAGMSGCGGSSNSATPGTPPAVPPSSPPPSAPSLDPAYRVSGASPFASNCDNGTTGGTAFVNAEVEPSFAVNPTDSQNLVAVWQEDRWSTGGASCDTFARLRLAVLASGDR